MLFYTLSFVLGICALHGFPYVPSLVFPTAILLFLIFIKILIKIIVLKIFKEFSLYRVFKGLKLYQILINGLIFFCVGFLYVSMHAQWQLAKNLPEMLEGKQLVIKGQIAGLPEHRGEFLRFEFDVHQVLSPNIWENPGKVRLRLPLSDTWQNSEKIRLRLPRAALSIEPGDIWQFSVKLKRPHGYANPNSFDYEQHLFLRHLVAEGKILDPGNAQLLRSEWYQKPFDRFRAYLKTKMLHHLKDRPHGPEIMALVLGIKEDILPETWAVFQKTGTSHLMAISGLHVGLVAIFAFALMRFLLCRFVLLPLSVQYLILKIPIEIWGAAAAVLAAFGYAELAGFAVPTQRAVVMISIFMLGILFRRVTSKTHIFCFAVFLVLGIDPFSSLSAGFWLSFVAVGMLLYGMGQRVSIKGFWYKHLKPQWVVFLGLLPLCSLLFEQISLLSPLVNFIAIPWVSLLVLPLALMGSFCLLLSNTIGGFLLNLAETLLTMLWPILKYFHNLSFGLWQNSVWTIAALGFALLSVLWILTPSGFPGRQCALILLLPLCFGKSRKVLQGTAEITILDVGQGLSTVVETQNHVLIYDTGPKLSPDFDTGDRVVIPFLRSRGIKQIDTIIISHADNDHIGGLSSILKKTAVKEIISSEPERILNKDQMPANVFELPAKILEVRHCVAGQKWEWDGFVFEILHPQKTHNLKVKKRNDLSCVLRIQGVGQRGRKEIGQEVEQEVAQEVEHEAIQGIGKKSGQAMLLTGDIEATAEQGLIDNHGTVLRSDILVVPHHGSKTSSTLDFIQNVKPKYAVIPVGYRNAYGHPKTEVVERYKEEGVVLFDSVSDGAVSFVLNQEGVLIPNCYRKIHRRYWMK